MLDDGDRARRVQSGPVKSGPCANRSRRVEGSSVPEHETQSPTTLTTSPISKVETCIMTSF